MLVFSLFRSTQTGSACVVDEADAGEYQMIDTQFKFLTGNTGTIVARCHVTNPRDTGNPVWSRLYVTYKDQDGSGASSRVEIRLYRVSLTTGTLTSIQTFNSNSLADAVTSVQKDYVSFVHTFDFFNYAYYVYLSLNRGSTTYDPSVYAVQLVLGID
jgi:hypothetical protein